MKFACPTCEQRIEADEEWGGRTVSCPNCGQNLVVPMLATRVEPPSRSPVRVGSLLSWVVAHKRLAMRVAFGAVVLFIAFTRGPLQDVSFFQRGNQEATLAAWNQLSEIHYALDRATAVLPGEKFRWASQEYSRINLRGVDKELQRYIQDSAATYRQAAAKARPIDQEAIQAVGQAEFFRQMGGVVGSASRDQYHPHGQRESGEFFFGMIGAMAAQEAFNELQPKYDQAFAPLKLGELMGRGNYLRAQLSRKYGVEFMGIW